MDDLISREAVYMANEHLKPCSPKDVEDMISCIPSAQQWIPCSEQLPKDFEDVLVWYEYFRYGEYNRMYQTWDVGYYNSKFNIWGGSVIGSKIRAIAWMPLPEPYKEVGVNDSI